MFHLTYDDKEKNTKILKQIISETKAGRMPLLTLAFSLMSGHAVVAKSVDTNEDGTAVIHLYDPNYPRTDSSVINFKDGLFDFSQYWHGSVTIKDADEMDELQAANYTYYSKICSALSGK